MNTAQRLRLKLLEITFSQLPNSEAAIAQAEKMEAWVLKGEVSNKVEETVSPRRFSERLLDKKPTEITCPPGMSREEKASAQKIAKTAKKKKTKAKSEPIASNNIFQKVASINTETKPKKRVLRRKGLTDLQKTALENIQAVYKRTGKGVYGKDIAINGVSWGSLNHLLTQLQEKGYVRSEYANNGGKPRPKKIYFPVEIVNGKPATTSKLVEQTEVVNGVTITKCKPGKAFGCGFDNHQFEGSQF